MDPKELSPAYFTSLAATLVGVLLVGVSSYVLSLIGWVVLLLGLGLNIFSTLVMAQRLKGGSLPALLTGERGAPAERETRAEADVKEPEADTETQPVISRQTTGHGSETNTTDERIFRSQTPRPRVR